MAQWYRIRLPRQETWVQSLGWEDPLEKEMALTPVFLPEKFHGQRSLAGCSLWGCKESDTTERLSTAQVALRDGAGLSASVHSSVNSHKHSAYFTGLSLGSDGIVPVRCFEYLAHKYH